jgi:hypothetical protein
MRPGITPVSRRRLVQAHLNLSFLQPIALLLVSVQHGVQSHLSGACILDTGAMTGLKIQAFLGVHKALGWVTTTEDSKQNPPSNSK